MSDPSSSDSGAPRIPPIAPIPVIPPIPTIPPVDAPPPVAPLKRTHDPAADAFFLPPENSPDPLRFRGEVKDALNVTPIIDGIEIFKEFETQIANAQSSVLIAFWAFDPLMPLVTDSSMLWVDLLLDAAQRGVLVRLLMNDFDPGLTHAFHRMAWNRYFTITTSVATVPLRNFQVVCALHEAEIAETLVKLHVPTLFADVAATINRERDPDTRFKMFTEAPGVWDKLVLGAGNRAAEKKSGASYPACPAAHHQKLIIVDGKFAYTGGANLTGDYADSPKHNQLELPWHDAFVKVEGSVAVEDFIKNYVGLWNKERIRMKAFLDTASKATTVVMPSGRIRDTTELKEHDVRAVLTSTIPPKIPSQVHRTISVRGPVPFIPEIVRQDVLDGYLKAIEQAELYIYIENQYFREREIAEALIKRHTAKSGLKTILLLPRLTEELLGPRPDALSLQGETLQFELLTEMTKKIGSNLGLFTLVPNLSRAARTTKELIYVHSKLIIIDDKFASIGSANLNPRSMRIDTELDFAWHNEQISRKLRIDLWNEALGKPSGLGTWKPTEFIPKWSTIAKRNKSLTPRFQTGFVIPFEIKRFAAGNPLLAPFT
jgi:phosphatidylserine/phosphatidylglycerophosphate/cardiolipin synthase-like enzyme